MFRKLLFAVMAVTALAMMGQSYTVSATKYHPGMGGASWKTASGARIDNTKLKNYEIRWVAISQDLLKKGFRMNDTIEVTCERVPKLNGKWVIKDCMGPRVRMKIDFLLPKGDNYGFSSPTKVTISKAK